jgi:hypothetical protein
MTEPLQASKPALGKPGTSTAPSSARLILQDPQAWDQATQPALRNSFELNMEAVPSVEREQARELWESLSLEPQEAQERLAERKRLLARSEALALESQSSKVEIAALKAQLAQERDNRWNHPLIYAGAAGIATLGALWWLERRKRLQLQDRELEAQASAVPWRNETQAITATEAVSKPTQEEVFAGWTHDASDVTSSLPPNSVPPWAQAAAPEPSSRKTGNTKTSALTPSDSSVAEKSFLGLSKRVLGNILRRKSSQDHASQLDSYLPSQSNTQFPQHSTIEIPPILPSSTSAVGGGSTVAGFGDGESTQWLDNEEAQWAFEQELLERQLQENLPEETMALSEYDPDQANIELLTQTRVAPYDGESTMEHLLELRTATSGLCALGRPEGALSLLEEHIATTPDTCAWAYVEYMHICELLDQRDPFESMRKRYRLQYNRMAAYWHEPNGNVLGLDGYARAANELCIAWKQGYTPARHLITAWLTGTFIGRKLVQLPAYHDLFDLYEMLEYIDETHELSSDSSNTQEDPLTQAKEQFSLEEQDFVPTVSLLDLDYEFSTEVTLEEHAEEHVARTVPTVKTGNFSVDFNVAGTQLGALPSMPGTLPRGP